MPLQLKLFSVSFIISVSVGLPLILISVITFLSFFLKNYNTYVLFASIFLEYLFDFLCFFQSFCKTKTTTPRNQFAMQWQNRLFQPTSLYCHSDTLVKKTLSKAQKIYKTSCNLDFSKVTYNRFHKLVCCHTNHGASVLRQNQREQGRFIQSSLFPLTLLSVQNMVVSLRPWSELAILLFCRVLLLPSSAAVGCRNATNCLYQS